MTIAAVSSVMITLTLVAIFASVIFNTAKLATDIETTSASWFMFVKTLKTTVKPL